MAIQGTLSTTSVPDLLQFLEAGRKTGVLRFDRDKISKDIHFQEGTIIGSFSNDPKEYLGQVLIHYGKIDEPQLQQAMEAQRKTGARLGEILVSKGLTTEAEVLEILRIRTLEIIYDLFLWEQAKFEFFDNKPFADDLIRINVQPQSVIMDGIYRIDEWARFRSIIPSERALLKLEEGWTAKLNTSKEVRQILYYVEKGLSVAEICYNMHASPFHICAKLYQLIEDGVARVAGEAPATVEPPPKEAPKSEPAPKPKPEVIDLVQSVSDLLWSARAALDDGRPDDALPLIQKVLKEDPKNTEAQGLLLLAEGISSATCMQTFFA